MGAIVHPSFIGALVRHLPQPVLRALDAWAAREARRRREQRLARWQRKAAPAAVPAQTPYHLKPWRD
jgi:hypothetical protein